MNKKGFAGDSFMLKMIMLTATLVLFAMIFMGIKSCSNDAASPERRCRLQMEVSEAACASGAGAKVCLFPQKACTAQEIIVEKPTDEKICETLANAVDTTWWMSKGRSSENLFRDWFSNENLCMRGYIIKFDTETTLTYPKEKLEECLKNTLSTYSADGLSVLNYVGKSVVLGKENDAGLVIAKNKYYAVSRVSSKTYGITGRFIFLGTQPIGDAIVVEAIDDRVGGCIPIN